MALSTPAPRVLADAIPGSRRARRDPRAGGAAFVGLAAQVVVTLPFTPVPVTGQTFAVLLAGAALGSVRGLLAMTLYLVAGMLGVPWFAERHGVSQRGRLTPSFGYIVGFVLAGRAGRLAGRAGLDPHPAAHCGRHGAGQRRRSTRSGLRG